MNILDSNKRRKISQTRPCKDLSLVSLIQQIVVHNGRQALEEFHNARPVFVGNAGKRIRFLPFLQEKIERIPSNDRLLLDEVRDLTVDKFCHLPSDQTQNSNPRAQGPDCRNYFGAFLSRWEEDRPTDLTFGQQETLSATYLQNFVIRHIYLSYLECKRRLQNQWTKYIWQAYGRSLHFWFPRELSSSERKQWLKDHVLPADLKDPWIRSRIQSYIYEQFKQTRKRVRDVPSEWSTSAIEPDMIGISVNGLAKSVALEKRLKLAEQRPAIRSLGAAKLQQLILRLFQEIGGEYCELAELAHDFDLSASTLSRFAGIRWSDHWNQLSEKSIPDLWSNTAQLLSRDPVFMEFASEIGIWERIQYIAAQVEDRRDSHGT